MTKPADKIRLKRIPKRGIYNRDEIFEILDKDYVCNVAFVYEEYPVIIPTIYGRKGDKLYLHGAGSSRMMKTIASGIPICICVTQVNGIVLARSLFNSSMNYESVFIFGRARLIDDPQEKNAGLAVVSDQILKGRWDEARQPSSKELKATMLFEVTIEEASAKRREGDPGDDKPDYELVIWAGVIPINRSFGPPIPDTLLRGNIKEPNSVKNIYRS